MSSRDFPVEAVLLDAGNTLIRVRGSVGAVYAAVARRHGLGVEAAALDRSFRQVFRERRSAFLAGVSRPHSPERERAWWRGLVREVLRRCGVDGVPPRRFGAFFDDLYETFARPDPWQVYPDALECLEALEARGIPVGVVSNWDSRLREVLDGLGLARRFRFVLVSAEFGAEKPDPSIFREAVRRMGVGPERVVHAGDLYREDVLGARAAGLHAVLVDREGTAPFARPRVRDLRGLVGLVEAWQGAGRKPDGAVRLDP